VLRRIFVPKKEEVTGGWRKLHSEKLNNVYSSPDVIRMIESRRVRWAGHVAHMGGMRSAYKILFCLNGVGISRRIILVDLKEIGCEDMG
jgi:hypothetical protein